MAENNSSRNGNSSTNPNWMRLNLPVALDNTGAISNQVGNAVSGIMPTIMGHNPHRIVVSRSSSIDTNQSQQTPVSASSNNDIVLDLSRLQQNNHEHDTHEFLHQGLQIDPESLQNMEFGSDENMNDNHEHSHGQTRPQLTNLLSNSLIFIIIVLFKLLSDHILGKNLKIIIIIGKFWDFLFGDL